MPRKKKETEVEEEKSFVEALSENPGKPLMEVLAEVANQGPNLAEDPAADLLDDVQIEANPSSIFGEGVVNMSEGVDGDDCSAPLMCSPEWTDYVLGRFQEDELVNGHPKVDGLRRVVEELLGPVIQCEATIKHPPCPENDYSAAVECRVVIDCFKLGSESQHGLRVFQGAADVSPKNTEPKFARFPTALAETRAMGRAYRNALRFNKCAFEELTEVPVDPQEEKGLVSKGNISFWEMMCQRLDIDLKAMVSHWLTENGKRGAYRSIREIRQDDAREIAKKLNEYQRGVCEIPEKIRGYKKDWNSNEKGE